MRLLKNPNLFDAYVALGLDRSYARVARDAGLSKASVAALGKREGWKARLALLEQHQRKEADRRAVDRLVEEQLAPLRRKLAVFSEKFDIVCACPIHSAGDALDLLEFGVHMETCLRARREDVAEQLLDLFLLRMLRRGYLAAEKAMPLLCERGFAA
jgi:hypothetical protein